MIEVSWIFRFLETSSERSILHLVISSLAKHLNITTSHILKKCQSKVLILLTCFVTSTCLLQIYSSIQFETKLTKFPKNPCVCVFFSSQKSSIFHPQSAINLECHPSSKTDEGTKGYTTIIIHIFPRNI